MLSISKTLVFGVLLVSVGAFAQEATPPLCVGADVFDINGNHGTVKAIYPNGQVAVYYSGANIPNGEETIPQDPSALARVDRESADGLHVNDQTIDRSGNYGTVRAIFPSGQVAVYYSGANIPNGEEIIRQDTKDLARTKGTILGLHIGDQIIDPNGNHGTVEGIFQDGQVAVYYSGANIPNGEETIPQDPNTLGRVYGCTEVSGCLQQMSSVSIPGQQDNLLEASANFNPSKRTPDYFSSESKEASPKTSASSDAAI
jgi:CMP-2-keto-3-deoxyoctulosonic acid synthetase